MRDRTSLPGTLIRSISLPEFLWTSLASTAVALLLATGCSESSDPTTASAPPILVEPDVAVAGVRGGMTLDQVISVLGRPPRRTDKAVEYPKLGLAVLCGPDGLAQYVLCGDVTGINGPFVRAFNGRTKEGIGMYSTRADILKAYGEPTEDARLRLGAESLRYDPLGITFTLDGGKVHHMAVRLSGGETNQSIKIEMTPEPKGK